LLACRAAFRHGARKRLWKIDGRRRNGSCATTSSASSAASSSGTSSKLFHPCRTRPIAPRRKGITLTSASAGPRGGLSLQTKKIKGVHENDFITAARLDRILAGSH
jgi:hypothetical protein